METWKKVPGWGGFYEVSDLGRVRCSRFGKLKIKKQSNHINGYLTVGLYYDGKAKIILVHRLVYWVFRGFKSCSKIHIDHINRIKTDNRLCNLRTLTNGENTSLGKIKTAKGWRITENGKYEASISINKVNITLGRYKNPKFAEKIYKKAYRYRAHFNGNKEEFKKLIGVEPRKIRKYSVTWYSKSSKWRAEFYCNNINKLKHHGYFKSKVLALVSLKENKHI